MCLVLEEKIFMKRGSISNMSLTSSRLRATLIEYQSRADLRSVYRPNLPVARLPVCIAATIYGVNLTHASFTTIDRMVAPALRVKHGRRRLAGAARRGASNSLRSARQHARASPTMIYARCRYNVVRTTSSPSSADFQSLPQRPTTRRPAACPGGPTLTRT